MSFDSRPLSELTVFRDLIRFSMPSKIYTAIKLMQENTSWVALAESPNNLGAGNWHPVDAMTRTYFWIEQPGGANQEEPAMTIPDFVAKHGSGQAIGFIGAGTCDGFTPTTVYVDDFRVSAGANTQVVNFEIPFTPTVGISTSATAITHGGSLTVTGTLKYGSTPLAERVMHLYAQVGSATPTVVAKKKTSSTGVARAVVAPTRNTTYTWYFPEAGNYGSKFSGARLVFRPGEGHPCSRRQHAAARPDIGRHATGLAHEGGLGRDTLAQDQHRQGQASQHHVDQG